ncbi:ABC-type branched-subunit amino acid transport system substrate-binding protein [Antricoccus suffuscus]|uniref:ABC-type branched-subunit amino acid transport system substrate-binding protein n=1 Tax=Antricoccus suffuscus TaxID=1629062 RepID=A0A2T1A6U6_9ACTN|nr:branched-chain amino acid ABC transporter substrate-binding protein [Antricoccus suffuscus]PRZ44321.1 ABC-type branched-subunit amino acid transport system substrate-binding protein [Antricoccus suffuscus]
MKSRFSRQMVLAAGAAVTLVVSVGCGSSGSGTSASGSSSPIIVGLVQPYSGAESYYGKYADNAWTMAMAKYGSKIKGHPIKLVKGDSKCDPATAVSVAHKILAQKPVAIEAPDCSGDTLAMLPITTAKKVPLVSENLAPDITTKGSKYVWRVQASDAATNKLFAKYIVDQGHKSIGVINDTTSYGVANAATLVSGLAKSAVKPDVEATYDIAATDYSGQILKVKQANVEAAYFEGYDLQEGNLVKQARSLGLTMPIYGPTTASDGTFLKAAGDAAEGVVFATSFLPDWSSTATTFAKDWQDQFGYPPNMDSVGMYQAAVVTIKALQKAGPSATADDVNRAIKGLTVSGLPEGAVSFTSTGDLAHPLVMAGTWQGGATKLVKILAKPE